MKKIVAIIEKASDGGFGIYCKEIEGAVGYGETEAEAKEDFMEILQEQAEYYEEKKGTLPDWYSENIEVEYRYDFSGFFLAFPFVNASKFAEAVGINASLMRKYKEGLAFASEKQKALIQNKFNEIQQKMNLVQF